jgi:hypothetical protein
MRVLTVLPRWTRCKAFSATPFVVEMVVPAKERLQFARVARYEAVFVGRWSTLKFGDVLTPVKLLR